MLLFDLPFLTDGVGESFTYVMILVVPNGCSTSYERVRGFPDWINNVR